jgi:hypothetical protein
MACISCVPSQPIQLSQSQPQPRLPAPTHAEVRQQEINQLIDQAVSTSESCDAKINSMPEFKMIESRYIFSKNDENEFYKTTINDYASDLDIENILEIRKANNDCKKAELDNARKIDSRLHALLSSAYQYRDENKRKLISKEIKIGEYNKNVALIYNYVDSEFGKIMQAIYYEIAQTHQQETQQRMENFNNLLNFVQNNNMVNQQRQQMYQQQLHQQQQYQLQQQQLQNTNKPVTTNCYFIGNMLQCNSN